MNQESESQASRASDVVEVPRRIRRVAVAFRQGFLPGDWLQTWRKLDRAFFRAHLQVKAILAALDELPADVDMVVVPPELEEDARASVPADLLVFVTTAADASSRFATLVAQLEAGIELTADAAPEEPPSRTLVSYRGQTILD